MLSVASAMLVVSASHSWNAAPTVSTATCLPGIMGGGNLAVLNITLPAATTFCFNNSKCSGYSANVEQDSYPKACNNTTAVWTFYFKDRYGAERRTPNAAWSSWLVKRTPTPTPPSPSPSPLPPSPTLPVIVSLGPLNKSRSLPLLGYGTELVGQNTNDTGILAEAAVAAGSAAERYPGGTPVIKFYVNFYELVVFEIQERLKFILTGKGIEPQRSNSLGLCYTFLRVAS